MSDLTKSNGGMGLGLPVDFFQKLAAGIAESRATTRLTGGGPPFLRLLKDGRWVFGQTDEEVQERSRWIVNLRTLGHGYVCWINSKIEGEVMTHMAEAKPPRPGAINGVEYAEQRACIMKCLDGDDAGTEVLYKTNSKGGLRAFDGLITEIQRRCVSSTPEQSFPVLMLGKDYYKHDEYGRIYTPVFTVVGWGDDDGNLEGQPKVALAQNPQNPQTPPRPKKAPLQAAPEQPQGVIIEDDEEDFEPPPRRRPGRPRAA